MIIELNNIKEKESSIVLPLRKELDVFMQNTGISKTKVADLLNLPSYKNITNIIEGTEEITIKVALGISELVGKPINEMIESDKKEIISNNMLSIDNIKYASFLYSNFDIKALISINLFNKEDSDKEKCNKIIDFFGISSIFDYKVPDASSSALFSKRKTAQERRDIKMTNFWLATAYQSFLKMANPNEYNRDLVIEFVKNRIKSYTKNVTNGFPIVIYVLYKLGVTILVQDYMTHTHAYGVSMIVKGKPCIVLTGLGGHYYKLWCTLLHELYHILHDWDILQDFKCMISHDQEIEKDLFVSEEDANMFAYNCLVPMQLYDKLELFIYSKIKVKQIADKLNIHPTIIYGIYLELIKNKSFKSKEFARLSYTRDILLTKETDCLSKITYNPVEEGGIVKSVQRIKDNLYSYIA